jgi:hypothetical protein
MCVNSLRRRRTHACTHARCAARSLARTHRCFHTFARTHRHANTHACAHTNTHTRARARAQTHTHTHTVSNDRTCLSILAALSSRGVSCGGRGSGSCSLPARERTFTQTSHKLHTDFTQQDAGLLPTFQGRWQDERGMPVGVRNGRNRREDKIGGG